MIPQDRKKLLSYNRQGLIIKALLMVVPENRIACSAICINQLKQYIIVIHNAKNQIHTLTSTEDTC